MKQSHLALISGLILLVILAVSWCGRQPRTGVNPLQLATPTPTPTQTPSPTPSATPVPTPNPSPSVSPTPTPGPTQTPSENLRKAIRKVEPSVILISVFDSSGALLRSGTGFFVARDGRLITNWHLVEGGAHAVAKSSDGKIRNIPGILASSNELDLAVLRAETTIGVPFLPLSNASEPPNNVQVAVVGSSLAHQPEPLATETITAQQSSPQGEWLATSGPIPVSATGAPVIDENGKVLGVVTSGQESGQVSGTVVRPASVLEKLLTNAKPTSEARWAVAAATGSPSSSVSPEPSAEPSPTPEENRRMKIIYAPPPRFPPGAMFERRPGGSGRFRVVFNARGQAVQVQVLKSTGQPALDQAAVEALRQWRSEPGHKWRLIVPMTFRPR
jgi:TonB family protein